MQSFERELPRICPGQRISNQPGFGDSVGSYLKSPNGCFRLRILDSGPLVVEQLVPQVRQIWQSCTSHRDPSVNYSCFTTIEGRLCIVRPDGSPIHTPRDLKRKYAQRTHTHVRDVQKRDPNYSIWLVMGDDGKARMSHYRDGRNPFWETSNQPLDVSWWVKARELQQHLGRAQAGHAHVLEQLTQARQAKLALAVKVDQLNQQIRESNAVAKTQTEQIEQLKGILKTLADEAEAKTKMVSLIQKLLAGQQQVHARIRQLEEQVREMAIEAAAREYEVAQREGEFAQMTQEVDRVRQDLATANQHIQ